MMKSLILKCILLLLQWTLVLGDVFSGSGGSTSGDNGLDTSDESITTRVLNYLRGLPLPVVIGVGVTGGVGLIAIILLSLISTIALLRQRYYKNRVTKVKTKRITPGYSSRARVAW